ncbi:MAG: isoprenylcysteine carboxylmethyltransferase family protein [Actinobacteria bacterium]|nr:isoprenylcysteine carboxylmethyltransferase family protein [Actinomycetota bacterium]
MQLIPLFKLGILNAWIFVACFLLLPYSIMLINKKAYKKLGNPPDINRREKVIGYIATIIAYIAFLYSIFLPFKLGTAWFYIGLFIFLLAIVLLITAGINFITTPIDRAVTKGMYGYSRHPIYLSNLLALIGIGIATASWIILLAAIIFLILVNIVANSEEHYCKEKYGDIYKEYLNRTPKWIGIPKL